MDLCAISNSCSENAAHRLTAEATNMPHHLLLPSSSVLGVLLLAPTTMLRGWCLLLLLPRLLVGPIGVGCCRLLLLLMWGRLSICPMERLLLPIPCPILWSLLVRHPLLLWWWLVPIALLLLVPRSSRSSSSSRCGCPVGHVGRCLGPRGWCSRVWGLHGVGRVRLPLLAGVHGVLWGLWCPQVHVAHVLRGL